MSFKTHIIMNTLQLPNYKKMHLMHKIIEPLTGCLTAVITMSWFSNFLLSMFTAAMGAAVGYIVKKVCDHIYNKYVKNKRHTGKRK